MQFTVTLEESGKKVFLFQLKGEMDVSTAPELGALLGETLLNTVRFVLFDLSGLRFVDTVGVGCLAAEARRLQEMGAEVAFLAPKGQVQKVIELTNLDRTIPVFTGLEEAYKKLGIDR